MSKRKPATRSLAYSEIRFVCPRGHHLKPRALRVDPPSWTSSIPPQPPRYILNPGIQRIDGPNDQTKLRMSCPKCQAAGRPVDLQVSWESVRSALDELHAEEHLATRDLQIGG